MVSAIPGGLKLKVLVPILTTLCSTLNLESNIYVEDCGDDTDIEIIDNKKVIDFLNTFKTILNNPNIKGEFRTNLTDALINQDYGLLDAEDMDYILQTCIFGSCVYG